MANWKSMLIAGLLASGNLYADDAKLSTMMADTAGRVDKAAGAAVEKIPDAVDSVADAVETAAIKADQFAFFFVLTDKELSDAVFMRR